MKVILGFLGCMLFLAVCAGETVGGLEGERDGQKFNSPRDRWACGPDVSPMGSITPCLEGPAFEDGYEDLEPQDGSLFWYDFTTAFIEEEVHQPRHEARVISGIMVNITEGGSPFSATDFTVVSVFAGNNFGTAFMEPELPESLPEARVEARTATRSRKAISLRASTLVTRAAFLGAAALLYFVFTLTAKTKLLRQRCDQLEKERAMWMFVDRPGKAVTQQPHEQYYQQLKALNTSYRQDLLALHQQHQDQLSRKQSDVDQLRGERDRYARLLSTNEAQRRAEREDYRRLLSASEEQRQDSPAELQELRRVAAAAELRAKKAEEALRLQTETAEKNMKSQCQKAEAETQALQQLLAERAGHVDALQIEVLALRTKSAETRGELETRNLQIAVLKDEARAMVGKMGSLMRVNAKLSGSRRLAKAPLSAGLPSKESGMRDGGVAPAVAERNCEPDGAMECDAPQAVASGASEIACDMDCELPQASAAVQCQMEVDAPQGAAVPLHLPPNPLIRASSCDMPQAGRLPERTASCEMAQAVDLVDASANLPALPVTGAASSPGTQQAPEPPFVAPAPHSGYAGPAPEPQRAVPFPSFFPATSPLLLPAPPQYSGPPTPPVRDACDPGMSHSPANLPAEERGVASPEVAANPQGSAEGVAKKARKARVDKRRAAGRPKLGPAEGSSASPLGVELGGKRRADSRAEGDMERAMGPPGETPACPPVTPPAQHTADAEPELAPAGSIEGEPQMPLPADEMPTSATGDSEEDCLPEPPMASESRPRTASAPRKRRTDFSRLKRF